ncbi:MAG TPA: cyclase family protein [Gemmatimonadota bacterium]|nr:cyclase family protein [Gemmatimonadota bacterium]
MIDITRPLSTTTAAWPGDAPLKLDWTLRLAAGDNVSVSRISLSPHVGTHADAPAHYDADGASTGAFSLASFLGPARVIDVRGHEAVTIQLLEMRGAIGATRLLVRSLESVRPEKFDSDFPPLAPEAAEALVAEGLVLYGTDAPSVDPVDSAAMAAHRVLGNAAIPILENLDLSAVQPGDYDLLALPVKLIEAEATPVRAVLLPPGTLVI